MVTVRLGGGGGGSPMARVLHLEYLHGYGEVRRGGGSPMARVLHLEYLHGYGEVRGRDRLEKVGGGGGNVSGCGQETGMARKEVEKDREIKRHTDRDIER